MKTATLKNGLELTLRKAEPGDAAAIAAMRLGLCGAEVHVTNPGGVNVVKLALSEDGRTIFPKLEGAMLMTAELEILPEALL